MALVALLWVVGRRDMVCAPAYDEDTKRSKYQRVRDAVFFMVLTMKVKRNWKEKTLKMQEGEKEEEAQE